MEPKTGKKIVSKGEHERLFMEREISGLLGIVLMGMGITCGASALLLCLFKMNMVLAVLMIAISYGLCRMGLAATKRANNIDPGVPLPRANTGDLSASDSLVRASAEPIQQQQAVLLRAATQTVETPMEQLVRAVNRPE